MHFLGFYWMEKHVCPSSIDDCYTINILEEKVEVFGHRNTPDIPDKLSENSYDHTLRPEIRLAVF